MKVLVTGAEGFIGKNLIIRLQEQKISVISVSRKTNANELSVAMQEASFIVHLAGVNRPKDNDEFNTINVDFTRYLCELARASGRKIPIIYTSSIQAEYDNQYGISKRLGEGVLLEYHESTKAPLYIYRLPNVFGKWCKPNYNSVVATFCHNIAHQLPIHVNDPDTELNLVYIDDVIKHIIDNLLKPKQGIFQNITPVYSTTVGELATVLNSFKVSRDTNIIPNVGQGLTHALYSTYLSYLECNQFSYPVMKYEDNRGIFVEMLKTEQAGQFSYFTAYPGVTRGGHYHHTKTEKFLVIEGDARFRFRHIISGETYEYCTSSSKLEVVETIPGWSHDITNIGSSKMVVFLWANEIFDSANPDTVMYEV